MERINVTDLFFTQAGKSPGRCAIVHGKSRISYGELATEVKQTAAYFQSRGIRKGDKVLVFVPMGIDLYRTVLALFDLGAVVVFLDEWVSRERLDVCCRLAGCKAWIGGWKVSLLSVLSKELRNTPLKLGLNYKKGLSYQKTETTVNDHALITFTTGSTGIPKAAIRTHAHLKSQFEALIEKIQPEEGEVDLPVLPIVLLINLGAGCTSVIAPFKSKKAQKMKPEVMVNLMQREKVDRLVSSPYFATRVAEYCTQSNISIPSLKKVFTGGAPVFPDEAALLANGFLHAAVTIVYGSTEAEPISAISANLLKKQDLNREKGLCVGEIHSSTGLLILPITAQPITVNSVKELLEMQLKPGETGEICVSGPHVLESYLDNEEAVSRNKIHTAGTCWHRTGDSGFIDENGILYLTGRAANVFEKDQLVYSPFILEFTLKQLDKVNSGTILKINELVILFVDLKDSSVRADFLREKFPFVDQVVVGELPKDPRHFSKIDYGKLKEKYISGRISN
ncbi:2,3-dihydroxybenzoate-AMP ligase [compost metagenome]